MVAVSNKSLIFKAIPETFPEASKHLIVEDRPIDLDTVHIHGGILLKVLYASFDPYMRGRMRDPSIKSYSPPMTLNEPVDSAIVGKVIRSEAPEFKVGDIVSSFYGPNAEYAVIPYQVFPRIVIRKVHNPHNLPLSYFIGYLGMPGTTVYQGLYEIAKPKTGETIFVSSAAGAVGQLVGQICKAEGLRVIGSAGSKEKVEYVKSIGFDGVFNYKEEKPGDALERLAPNGIDIYWDNVGGEHLEAALEAINKSGRIVACGSIDDYNTPFERRHGIKNYIQIIVKSVLVQGFIVDVAGRYQAMLERFTPLFASGKFRVKEDIYEGIDKAPEALVGIFRGNNFGKTILKIADR
ncbi:hypothetical protein DL764_006737 [Monosporascus ibericus]|uniref:Dehydrogenase FUB6 n=1 Tax=Monosporascus ibericus TaxID=155417 RepID=A0A4Q4T6B4_9PEZI|nr:hypothetical protein DL764_006737 [Monosporascus ibericus]